MGLWKCDRWGDGGCTTSRDNFCFYIFFSLPSVFPSLLLYLPQKLMWVTERVGKVKFICKCTDLRTNLFIKCLPIMRNNVRVDKVWIICFHTENVWCCFNIWNSIFFFPPEFNPQMVCLINSRRTVETEHPFKEKVLNRHYWSSVEETEKKKRKKKRPNIWPLFFSEGSSETDVGISPCFLQNILKAVWFIHRTYTHWQLDGCISVFFPLYGYAMLDKSMNI